MLYDYTEILTRITLAEAEPRNEFMHMYHWSQARLHKIIDDIIRETRPHHKDAGISRMTDNYFDYMVNSLSAFGLKLRSLAPFSRFKISQFKMSPIL